MTAPVQNHEDKEQRQCRGKRHEDHGPNWLALNEVAANANHDPSPDGKEDGVGANPYLPQPTQQSQRSLVGDLPHSQKVVLEEGVCNG